MTDDDGQIPELHLPSGGTVEFINIDDVTGWDLHQLRKPLSGTRLVGEAMNAVLIEALRIGVKNWNIPYLPDPRIPAENPSAWKKLRGRDLRAIEDALQPLVGLLSGTPEATEPDNTPGSPTQPDGE